MKSLVGVCAAVGLFCAVPLSAPPLARGSARLSSGSAKAVAAAPGDANAPSLLLSGTASGHYLGAPPVTRLQILDIARSALGMRYVHGAESWSAQPQPGHGTDCSGLIAKAWQVPHAAESWEELRKRPTTETLNVPTSRWFKLPVSERLPGDILVRYEAQVRHAFIYERDDRDYAKNGSIWVYEAAKPRVQHRRYRLGELAAYTLVRRHGIDDVGLVGRSRDWIFGDMVDAFLQAGGESALGTPYDRGDGILVHAWKAGTDSGVAQDFHGGQLAEAMLVQSRQRAGAFVVTGPALEAYRARFATGGWQRAVAPAFASREE